MNKKEFKIGIIFALGLHADRNNSNRFVYRRNPPYVWFLELKKKTGTVVFNTVLKGQIVRKKKFYSYELAFKELGRRLNAAKNQITSKTNNPRISI